MVHHRDKVLEQADKLFTPSAEFGLACFFKARRVGDRSRHAAVTASSSAVHARRKGRLRSFGSGLRLLADSLLAPQLCG